MSPGHIASPRLYDPDSPHRQMISIRPQKHYLKSVSSTLGLPVRQLIIITPNLRVHFLFVTQNYFVPVMASMVHTSYLCKLLYGLPQNKPRRNNFLFS